MMLIRKINNGDLTMVGRWLDDDGLRNEREGIVAEAEIESHISMALSALTL